METPAAWYPLAVARTLGPGQVLEIQAFAKRLALFRSLDGQLGVLDARCPHLGADLARGRVEHDHLRCPLHGRHFSRSGICGSHSTPVTAWPTVEAYGLVFLYLGPGEPPPLPCPGNLAEATLTAPAICQGDLALDHVVANAFDAAHLDPVHGRTLCAEPQLTALHPHGLRIGFTARVTGSSMRDRLLRRIGFTQVHLDIDCWGGSMLIFHHRRTGMWTLHAGLPINDRQTRMFTVSGAPPGWANRLRLRFHHRAALAFIAEDDVALVGMTPGTDLLDPVTDRTLLAWRDYAQALPRVTL